MAIIFHCEHCHKEVKAPDSAGGMRGKCPFCSGSNYIPNPNAGEEIDLAPLDEEEERRRKHEVERLLAAERALLAETSNVEAEPRLSQRDANEVKPEDLHHLVVNFLVAMASGQLEQADVHVLKLNQLRGPNKLAVRDFLDGKVHEPVVEAIPAKVREGFLRNLMTRMR